MKQIRKHLTSSSMKSKHNQQIFTFLTRLLLMVMVLATAASCYVNKKREVKIKVDGKTYKFEVALTETEKRTGLMNRRELDKNSGMLFVYGSKQQLSFYMKNTYIPLDIAFIDDDYKILNIESMEPLDETSILSKGRAMYALEANRGFFDRVGLAEGDTIDFITPIPYATN
jgi:uncharacterized membrane protein (UPF0127 family)